jgi:hypothetical protein
MACGSTDAHEGMLERDRTAALPRGRAPEEAAREAFIMVTIIDNDIAFSFETSCCNVGCCEQPSNLAVAKSLDTNVTSKVKIQME